MTTPTAAPTPWQRRAAALAERLPSPLLHPAVLSAAEAPAAEKSAWLLAVSGGSDSVALALLVWAHWPHHRERLVLVHFNHRLRGREATADARFCAALAKGLGVPFAGGHWDRPQPAAGEAEVRAARNAFFAQVAADRGASVLLTGHQRDDVAETMLMRLARGSGIGGLAAPRPIQAWPDGTVRWRPLLNLSREQLVEALTAAKVPWREDSSNTTEAFFRNRVRSRVIPAWLTAAGRDAVAGAARSRELLEEDEDALETWLAEIGPLAADGSLVLSHLAGKPKALWRRALHQWLGLQEDIGDLSRQGFDVLLEQARAGRTTRFSLGSQGFARIRRGRLYFEKPKA